MDINSINTSDAIHQSSSFKTKTKPKAPWETYKIMEQQGLTLRILKPNDCSLSDVETNRLFKAYVTSVKDVRLARKALESYGPNSPKRVQRLLKAIFSSTFLNPEDQSNFAALRANIQDIDDAFKGGTALKILYPPRDNYFGFVKMRQVNRSYTPKVSDTLSTKSGKKMALGHIHIGKDLLNESYHAHETMLTIIHEASHKYSGTDDVAWTKL